MFKGGLIEGSILVDHNKYIEHKKQKGEFPQGDIFGFSAGIGEIIKSKINE